MRYSSFLDLISETAHKIEGGLITDVEIDPKCGDAFSDEFFGHERMRRLGRTLMAKNNVATFTMRNVPVGAQGCLFLKQLLSSEYSPRVVILEDTTRDGTELAIAISECLLTNTTVEVLHLKANGIRSDGCSALGDMLSSNKYLKELRLCHNLIERDAAYQFGVGLSSNTSLETLDLTGNGMDDGCVAAICKGMAGHPSLSFVCFDFNSFGTKGVDAIAKMLEINRVLRALHLFGNHINKDGGILLGASLKCNQSLKTLILSFNDLGDAGAAALADSLIVNMTLEKLWLPANHLGNSGLQAFAELIPKMKGLKQLNVGDYFDNDGALPLRESMKLNTELEVLFMESVLFDDPFLEQDVDFYLRLNRAGRRLLRNNDAPLSLWSNVLSRAYQFNSDGPDVLFYLLREKPDLFEERTRC